MPILGEMTRGRVAIRGPLLVPSLLLLALLAACSGSPEIPDGGAYTRYSNPGGIMNGQARLPRSCQAWNQVIDLAAFVQPVQGSGACGIATPLQVYTAGRQSPVNFDSPPSFDCRFAVLMGAFIEGPMQEIAEEHLDSRVVSIGPGGSYACRTRNSVSGAKLSQHGKGLAFDLHSLRLADGRVLTVLDGWDGDSDESAFWQDLHAAACGPFNTVLGPEENRAHANHLHFDVEEERSGQRPYCR